MTAISSGSRTAPLHVTPEQLDSLRIFREYRMDALLAGVVPNDIEVVSIIYGSEAAKDGFIRSEGRELYSLAVKVQTADCQKGGSLSETAGINALSRYIDR